MQPSMRGLVLGLEQEQNIWFSMGSSVIAHSSECAIATLVMMFVFWFVSWLKMVWGMRPTRML